MTSRRKNLEKQEEEHLSNTTWIWSDIWNVSYIELRILKSSKLWSSQLWTQFKQLRTEAWKSQDFNAVWTRDLAIPVRRSNQLSYEATDRLQGSYLTTWIEHKKSKMLMGISRSFPYTALSYEKVDPHRYKGLLWNVCKILCVIETVNVDWPVKNHVTRQDTTN